MLVSGATMTVARYSDSPHLGVLLTTAAGNRAEFAIAIGTHQRAITSLDGTPKRRAGWAVFRVVERDGKWYAEHLSAIPAALHQRRCPMPATQPFTCRTS